MKIYIIVVIAIILSPLCADITNWTQFSIQSFLVEADKEITFVTGASPDEEEIVKDDPRFGIRWQHELTADLSKNLELNISNDLFVSEKNHEIRNSFNYDYSQLKLNYRTGNHRFRLQYSNRFYDEDETKITGLPGFDEIISQSMVHNTGFSYQVKAYPITFDLFANLRNLDYVTYDDEASSKDDDINWQHEWENDLYTWGKIRYDLTGNVQVFAETYYKNDLNDKNWFDENDYGVGLQYYKRFNFFNSLRTIFKFHIDDSQRLNDDQRNQFYTELRYVKRFGFNLSGFVSYKNYSCYDTDTREFLRISNLIRMQGKYSYKTDNFRDSFLLAGVKLNPENDGTLVFVEWGHNIWSSLFVDIGSKIALDLYTQYLGKLEYFLGSNKSIWMQTEMTDYENYHFQNLISVGTTIIF